MTEETYLKTGAAAGPEPDAERGCAAGERSSAKRLRAAGQAAVPYLFLLPALCYFAVFLFYPFFHTLFLSLFLTNNLGEAKVFRGLTNYIRLFQSADYRAVILNTLIFSFLVIFGSMLFGFVTANLANVRGRAFHGYQIIFAMPLAVSTVSFSVVFSKMFDPNMGIVNKLLRVNVQWFLDPRVALYSVALITVWMLSGSNFLYLYAALRGVPAELLESAQIDGAGALQRVLHISIPSISPILFFVLVTDITQAFQAFSQINVITQGGPANATDIMVYNIYRDAFFNFSFGSASAQSVVLFLIILAVTAVQFRSERRMVHYS